MSKRRIFVRKPVNRGYVRPQAAQVDADLYARLSASASSNIVDKFTIPKKQAKAWKVTSGQTVTFICAYGSQVGDVNIWNLHDHREKLYTAKTKQIHRTHLTVGDRLWSCHPYLRPLATITQDSLEEYGVDEDGCSVHDVLGTRCDPYIIKLMTGTMGQSSCHQNLMEAVKSWGLGEKDIHDVFNIFMCTGIHPDTHEYLIRGSPAEKGDYIEMFAEMDLLVACSACPKGDVSTSCGQPCPDEMCFPLDVHIGQPAANILQEWKSQKAF